MVVVPFFADQIFWGRLVHRLGAAPEPLPRQELTIGRLTAALRAAVGSPMMRASAEALGRLIRAEDGVETAVRAFEGWMVRTTRAAVSLPGAS
jgi:sterol 3beta-glucosyltransferase